MRTKNQLKTYVSPVFLVSCTGFIKWCICHILSFLEVQYFDSDDMMSPASIEMFTPTARGQCPMFAAGGEREACVSCQDPWDENNFEMRSYNVYNIIQHVTSSLVVTTRHLSIKIGSIFNNIYPFLLFLFNLRIKCLRARRAYIALHKNKISSCIHINDPDQDASFMPVLECHSIVNFEIWRFIIGGFWLGNVWECCGN